MTQVNPADIQKHLSSVVYPLDKDDLLEAARLEGADEDVLDALDGIADREYSDPADVMSEFNGA